MWRSIQLHMGGIPFYLEKIETFRQEVAPRKAIHLLMLTTFGVKQNLYSGIVQNDVTLDDLFAV